MTPIEPADSYNGTVTEIRRVHNELLVMRVRPDRGAYPIEAGQYTTLGLLLSEPRCDGVVAADDQREDTMLKRAYSFSCPMIEGGQLTTAADCDFFEFYIALVEKPNDDPPILTPRLFALEPGHRIFIGERPKGRYTLDDVRPDDDVLFVSTGTGEAPHNVMLTELLRSNHRGKIAAVVSVRYQQDLAYLAAYRELETRFPDFRYLPLTTREPINLDPTHPQFIGKKYVQNLFATGEITPHIGWEPSPERTRVFLCGNPAMIGIPKRSADGQLDFPEPVGMIEVLTRRGFTPDLPDASGNIHFEKYW